MFSALVVILLLAGPSLQFTLESADSDPDCSCKQISPSITRCELCTEPICSIEPDTCSQSCTVSQGPNANCSSMGPDLPAHKSQTRFQTKCRCRCKDDGICQCEVCPVVAIGALIEPGCATHEGPNLSCSSLQKSADLEAHKTQTRQQIQCSCTDYFNGSWRCQVCVNNSCKDKSGRGPKPAGCSHSWGPWRSDINYHGDDDLRAHKSQYQCNCQCDDDGCQGQCCDGNGCTSNPDCSRSSLELWSDNNYHGDDDLRDHKSLQCQCQCQNGVCQGNGCNNPACWF